MRLQKNSAYFYLFLTILSWSAIPAISRIALEEVDNYQLLLYTSLVGVVALFCLNAFRGKIRLLKGYGIADYLKMGLMGALGIFLYHIFLFYGYGNAPAGQANVFNYLWPVFIVIFSVPILKERVEKWTVVAVAICFLGALVAFTGGQGFAGAYAAGYASAAIAAVCYGLFSVLGKKMKYDKEASMLIYYVAALALAIPATIAFSSLVVPKNASTLISILVLGGMTNSIAFVFWFKALERGNTHIVANLAYAIPLLAMVWTYFLNAEQFSANSVLGLMLIILGIAIQSIWAKKGKERGGPLPK